MRASSLARRGFAALAAAAILAGAPWVGADSARAATLAFTGTLALDFPGTGYPNDGIVPIAGAGLAQVTGTPHLGSLLLPAGVFGPLTTAISNYAGTAADLSLVGIQNRSGSFAGGSGTMGFDGTAKICLIFDLSCTIVFVPMPIQATGTPAVGLGIGGTQIAPGPVSMTAQHAPWTLGQPVLAIHNPISTITTPVLAGGFAHGPASATSTSALPSGVVQFVTASRVFTSLTGAFPEFPLSATLTLHFVPEPRILLLLGSAALLLRALGRRRRP